MRTPAARIVIVSFLLTCGAHPAIASKRHEPVNVKVLTVEQVADAVVEAFRAGDPGRLKALAEKDDPDPWLVADELCFRGEHDAAVAFARGAARSGLESLSEHVGSWRGREADHVARGALGEMIRALQREDWEALLTISEGVEAPLESVTGIRIAYGRAEALWKLRRPSRSAEAFHGTAEAARRLGWLARSAAAYRSEGLAACDAAAWQRARSALQAALEAYEVTGSREGAARSCRDLGFVHENLFENTEALKHYARALELWRAIGDRAAVATASSDLGSIHQRLGSNDQALKLLSCALDENLALGDVAGAALALGRLGSIYDSLREYSLALAALGCALDAFDHLADRRSVAITLSNIASTHLHLRNYANALEAYQRGLKMFVGTDDRRNVAANLTNLGLVHSRRGDHPQALENHERALEVFMAIGDWSAAATALCNLGMAHEGRGDSASALDAYARALELSVDRGSPSDTAATLQCLGRAHQNLGAYTTALDVYGRALSTFEDLDDAYGVAETLSSIGGIRKHLGGHAEALQVYGKALDIFEALGDPSGVAGTLNRIGMAHQACGHYDEALEFLNRAFQVFEASGLQYGMSAVMCNIGVVHRSYGDFVQALELESRALEICEDLGDQAGMAETLGNIGLVLKCLGDYPEAMAAHLRALDILDALGHRAAFAVVLGNLGIVHEHLGDHARALHLYTRALDEKRVLGDRLGMAVTLANLGNVRRLLGEDAKALEHYTEALELFEMLDSQANVADVLGSLGNLHSHLGDRPMALTFHMRAHARYVALGDRAGIAATLTSIGRAHRLLGDGTQALEVYARALEVLRGVDDRGARAHALRGVAQVHLEERAYDESMRFAREAVEAIAGMVGGLGEQEGATARDLWTGPFDVGAQAALRAGSKDDLVYFLESGRAGGLREALGARRALAAVLIPADLRMAEASARAQEANALARYEWECQGGDRPTVREAYEALGEARDELQAVVQRIQREAKAGADVAYPEAASLAAIRGWLRDGEALLLLGRAGEEAAAVVVTPGGAEAHSLGAAADITALVEVLDLSDEGEDPGRVLGALHARVVKPLGLGSETTRVLVSPYGALSYVPFSLLLPEHEVAYVPSGTTYGLLTVERPKRGEEVLALGDPDYEVPFDPGAVSVVRRGRDLPALSNTRKEAKRVGDQVLLGRRASENELAAALKKQERWRAVHLACHGLIDAERPMFSSLALTPGGASDGFLTCLEVFRMKIPADLVVLSACETATGKIYRAEGIVGLTRAFMYAGAPRVLCSLWRVDDEATQALMIKFYELWNPRDGSKGLGAAAALKQAQEFVRRHEKWEHPYYWAAWVLWGLPD